jgi:uncharacterized Zn finger protein
MGWGWYPRAKPRRKANGIKAKAGRGQQFGKSWWASRWIKALEKLMDSGRLQRGRSYARSGQVLNLDIKPGRVDSRVQGSRAKPYKVYIEIKPLTDKEWDKVADAMAAQAIFAAKLLAGEMPQEIEEAFTAASVSLFPARRGDLVTECSCPDWANPCKHIAAVYYLLGEQFDQDPFLIFKLRGRDQDQIMAALRARRAAGKDAGTESPLVEAPIEETPVPLEDCLEHFWEAGAGLNELRFSIVAPQVNAAPVKRLGAPPFWHGRPDFVTLMSQAYEAATLAALEVAFGE